MNQSESLSAQEQETIWSLTQARDLPGLLHLLLQFGLIVISALVVLFSEAILIQSTAILVLGILLAFLFAPLHESVHKTAFATPWLNKVVGWICGWILILPPKYFQTFHMAHHRFTQIQGKDPELDKAKPENLLQHLWYLSGLPYWIGQIGALIGFALGKSNPDYMKTSRRLEVIKEARIYIMLYLVTIVTSIISDSTLLLFLWVIPILLGQPFLRGFLVAEHTGCPQVSDMFQNTRTTLTNPLVQWLCWNMCFHIEHHAFTGLPFHQLPNAHRILKPKLKNLGHGYIGVNRKVIQQLKT